MIIDTEQLQEAVTAHFAELAERADQPGRPDRVVIQHLTRLEKGQLEIDSLISRIEEVAAIFLGED